MSTEKEKLKDATEPIRSWIYDLEKLTKEINATDVIATNVTYVNWPLPRRGDLVTLTDKNVSLKDLDDYYINNKALYDLTITFVVRKSLQAEYYTCHVSASGAGTMERMIYSTKAFNGDEIPESLVTESALTQKSGKATCALPHAIYADLNSRPRIFVTDFLTDALNFLVKNNYHGISLTIGNPKEIERKVSVSDGMVNSALRAAAKEVTRCRLSMDHIAITASRDNFPATGDDEEIRITVNKRKFAYIRNLIRNGAEKSFGQKAENIGMNMLFSTFAKDHFRRPTDDAFRHRRYVAYKPSISAPTAIPEF